MSDLIIVLSLLLVSAHAAVCPSNTTIIPVVFLDSIFDATFALTRTTSNLLPLIQDPSQAQLKTYLLTYAPAVVPLLVMAVLSFCLFIGFCVQVLCFRCCNNEKFGYVINSSTYKPSAIKCGIALYIISAFFSIIICIACLVLSSDLGISANYVDCNTANVVTAAFNGSSGNTSAPWSGINNFNAFATGMAAGFQNQQPSLSAYFSGSTAGFTTVTATTPTSLYTLSQQFTCPVIAPTIANCPFAALATCPNPLNAQFSVDFCNGMVNTSAQSLISGEMAANSTMWLTGINNLSQALSSATLVAQLTALQTNISTLVSSFGVFQTSASGGLNITTSVIYSLQVAIYVFYAFIMLACIVGISAICCAFGARTFCCSCLVKYLWGVFTLMTILLFLLGGLMLSASYATYDACSAFNYYKASQANFNTLNLAGQTAQIFSTCYFNNVNNASSVLSSISGAAPVLTSLQQLQTAYGAAIPSPTFTTVVSSITNTLQGYIASPQTVVFQGQTSTNSAQAALNAANAFANYTASGSTQSCNQTKDVLVYTPVTCNGFLFNATVGSNACVQLAPTVPANRTTAFTNAGCASNGTIYTDNFNALYNYGQSIIALVTQYLTPNPFSTYQTAYFNYYVAVMEYMNAAVQTQFQTFLNPYKALTQSSSCNFVVNSINNLADTSCNQVFPFLNALAVLTIALAIFSFALMVLSYLLPVRIDFYAYLDGNFDNYVQPAKNQEITVELDSRNISLVQDTNKETF